MHIAIVGGASTIGSTVAYTITTYRQDIDITLIDPNEPAATGHATDLVHGAYHHAGAPTDDPRGRIRGLHPDDVDQIDPDLVVIAADKPRDTDGKLDRNFRDNTIDRIVDMLDDIVHQLDRLGPVPVVNATNPLDRVLYYFWKQLGWSRRYFMGYSLSETARVADAIGQVKNVHPNRVYCPTLGEHGEHMVLVFSKATVDGEPIELDTKEQETVREYVQTIPVRIANNRGLAESSRWVTSAGILRVIKALRARESTEPLCLSVPLQGEYGLDTGCLALPVMLGDDGIREVLEWDLTSEERDGLSDAHAAIHETLPQVER